MRVHNEWGVDVEQADYELRLSKAGRVALGLGPEAVREGVWHAIKMVDDYADTVGNYPTVRVHPRVQVQPPAHRETAQQMVELHAATTAIGVQFSADDVDVALRAGMLVWVFIGRA